MNGGLYVIRARHWKPGSKQRHFAWAGMTSNFHWREQNHLFGSGAHGGKFARAKDFSDLDATFIPVLPLPRWMTRTGSWGRALTWCLETLLIWAVCPVYNVKQQAPWNARRIAPSVARLQRAGRDAARRAGQRW